MCGIIGIIAKTSAGFYNPDVKLFENMLICNSIRGIDSSGVFGVLKNGQVKIVKQAAPPHVFLKTKTWEKYSELMYKEMKISIGHNRSATSGEVSNQNAHPFEKDNIILVHNGTLQNHKHIKNTEVDSDAICHGFAEKGVEETLQSIVGAWALLWYDLKEKKIFAIRNEERPLAIAETKERIFIASEGNMLAWLLSRDNIAVDKISQITPNVLYEISPSEIKTTKLKPKVISTTFFNHENSNHDNSSEARIISIKGLNYKATDKVIFVPLEIETSVNIPIQLISGYIYLPNTEHSSAICALDNSLSWADAKSLVEEPSLVVDITRIILKNGKDPIFWTNNPKKDANIISWNGLVISNFEAEILVKTLTCAKCGKTANIKNFKFISVRRRGMNTSIVCDSCVLANYDKWPENMKADALEHIQANNISL